MAFTRKKAVQPLRVSWSAIQTFLSCQRKYDLSYRENLQLKPSAEHRNLVLGSAFHAGLEAALRTSFEAEIGQYTMQEEWLLKAAMDAAQTYIKQATVVNKMVRDYTNGGAWVHDFDYYQMLREVSVLVVELLRYHIPLIGIGSRFIVPTVDDVLSGQPPLYRESEHGYNNPDSDYPTFQPAVEWHFEFEIAEATTLSGYIDTILWDVQAQEYVMVDWKTRGSFPADNMALIDGQLHLYAAVVNSLALNTPINKVVMYQMRTKPPSPASISAKGFPNTGAKSYDTTEAMWLATLPMGIHPEHYLPQMQGKFKTDIDYQRPVSGVVTNISSQMALDNVRAAVASIRAALDSGVPLPAILSSNGCKFCDFARLCSNALRYGGDVDTIVHEFYQPRIETEEAAED